MQGGFKDPCCPIARLLVSDECSSTSTDPEVYDLLAFLIEVSGRVSARQWHGQRSQEYTHSRGGPLVSSMTVVSYGLSI